MTIKQFARYLTIISAMSVPTIAAASSFWLIDIPAPNGVCWANFNWGSSPGYPVYRVCHKPFQAKGDACDYASQITSHSEICLGDEQSNTESKLHDNTIYRVFFYGWSAKKDKWKQLYKTCIKTEFVELPNGNTQKKMLDDRTCKKYKKMFPNAITK